MRDDNGETEMRRNVYVVVEGGTAVRNHLGVKRVLLEDEGARREYGDVKREIVESGDGVMGVGEYYKGKTGVLLRILRRAGLSEGELEEVRRANE